jgi:hypothetical protein
MLRCGVEGGQWVIVSGGKETRRGQRREDIVRQGEDNCYGSESKPHCEGPNILCTLPAAC